METASVATASSRRLKMYMFLLFYNFVTVYIHDVTKPLVEYRCVRPTVSPPASRDQTEPDSTEPERTRTRLTRQ